jgi:quercetin dioxygenase-like cupin family protein
MTDIIPLNWEMMEWEIVRPGVKRKVFHAAGCTLVLNAVDPGNQPKPHSHPHEQIVSILEGKTDFTISSVTYKLGSGSIIAIPPNVNHFIQVIGPGTCMNLDVFVPRRDDYVQSKIKDEKQSIPFKKS